VYCSWDPWILQGPRSDRRGVGPLPSLGIKRLRIARKLESEALPLLLIRRALAVTLGSSRVFDPLCFLRYDIG
jgi:hypothetical protein